MSISFINRASQKGFTLIELLMVFSIISLLASIVLASVVSARTKANDSKIKQLLTSMRTQAELYSGTGLTAIPAGTCPTGAPANNTLFDDISNGLGVTLLPALLPLSPNPRCASAIGLPVSGATWALAASLSSGFWCVDSTGWGSDQKKNGTGAYSSLINAINPGTTACT